VIKQLLHTASNVRNASGTLAPS